MKAKRISLRFYIVRCVSLFISLVLSISQNERERKKKPNLLGTPREIWDLYNKDIP
jgi:hypothetical protein